MRGFSKRAIVAISSDCRLVPVLAKIALSWVRTVDSWTARALAISARELPSDNLTAAVAYAYNPSGHWTRQHQTSLNGKRDDLTSRISSPSAPTAASVAEEPRP